MKKYRYIILALLLLLFSLSAYALPKFSENNKRVAPDPIYKKTVLVPQGCIINVVLKDKAGCNDISASDNIYATLSSDFIYKGNIIAPEGSAVIGKYVKKTTDKNSCKVKIKFTNIITSNGKNIPISAVFVEENSTGIISAFPDGKFFKENNADIIIKQPVTYIPD